MDYDTYSLLLRLTGISLAFLPLLCSSLVCKLPCIDCDTLCSPTFLSLEGLSEDLGELPGEALFYLFNFANLSSSSWVLVVGLVCF